MKAMLLKAPARVASAPLLLSEVEPPKPGPGQLLVRIAACGVCHTDLHTVEGEIELPTLPIIPGHQIVGRIAALGPEPGSHFPDSFRIGAWVGIPWLNSTCGKCRFCLSGRENLCENARFTGLHVNGGYAEYTVVDFRYACLLPPVPDPDTAAPGIAPLLCAGIIGLRALHRSGIRPEARVGLFGFGASAHIALQIARYWKCRVFVFTRGKAHQELALRLGAEWAGPSEGTPPDKLDSAVIFAPAGELTLAALAHLDRGGTIALAGIYSTPIPRIEYPAIYSERSITSVANSTRQDAQELLELSTRIPIRTEVEVFPLADANLALGLLKAGRINGAAVLKPG